jgi:hypothetical protein
MKAYPYMHKHPTSGQTTMSEGKDLRDWFAGKALQGLLAHKPWETIYSPQGISKEAYDLADAMMKQRKEVPNE